MGRGPAWPIHVVRRGRSLSGNSKVTRINRHDMAKKIEVWAHLHSYRGEWFVDERPHETKVGGTQKASTLVVHDDKHERVFTESEVRAMLKAVRDELWANCRWQSGVEVVSASAMRQAFIRPDVLSLDPA